jgi:hypothetical protein
MNKLETECLNWSILGGIMLTSMLVTLIALGVTGAFVLGGGYAISLLIPFSFFQASVIFMGVLSMGILVFGFCVLHDKLKIQNILLRRFVAGEEYDEEWDEKEYLRAQESIADEERRMAERAKLNARCRCGSGRKFRYCCMKKISTDEIYEVIHF